MIEIIENQRETKNPSRGKIFRPPLHFALFSAIFEAKMDRKRVQSDFFGMLGFWIDVLDDLAKEYFFFLPKCGENSNISVLGAFFPI